MKKSMVKRAVSIILCLCIMVSGACICTSAQTKRSSLGAFAIDRLYTSGFLFAGKTLVDIADATDVEELQGNN